MPYKDLETRRAHNNRPDVREKHLAKKRAYYLKNRDRLLAKTQQYASEHKEQRRQYIAEYNVTHKEEKAAYDTRYREDHSEKLRERKKTYYRENSTELLEKSRIRRQAKKEGVDGESYIESERARGHTYYVNNTEKCLDNQRHYRSTHPEIVQTQNTRRRARKRNALINDFTGAQWLEIKAAYRHRCVYCGRKMQRLTQDHIMPLSQGGAHSVSNIVPACISCNSKKHTGPPPVPVQPLLLTINPPKSTQ